jgi:hypothetical protein
MVLAEYQALVPVEIRPVLLQLVLQQIFQEQLFPQPDGDRHLEGLEPARRKCQIGFQQSFELEQWFVVEGNEVHLIEADPCLGQAVVQRVAGETRIVLLTSEPLFLRRSHDFAVADQRRRGVVVKRRDAYNPHRLPLSEQGIDERRHGRALREHDQTA